MNHVENKVREAISTETQNFLNLGARYRWQASVIGKGPLPVEQMWQGEWLIIPLHLDNTELPSRALRRINQIFANGLIPKGFVIVHEAPRMLKQGNRGNYSFPNIPGEETETEERLKDKQANISQIIFRVIRAIFQLVFSMFSLAMMLDPILIVVTAEDVWIEIDRWDTPVEVA